MNMGTSPDANAILVKNIPSTVDEHLLEVFFESRKKHGGGPVKSVKLFCDKQFAVVEFEEPESVQIVMKTTPIKFGNTTLDVRPYSPLLECDGNITSLDVNGLPKQLTDDILDMHLNSIAQPGVKNLCSEWHHLVSDVTLKGETWNTSLQYIPLPEPQTIQITKTQIQFLSRQCCQELKEELSHKSAEMELIDTGVTVKCTLTQRTPNCRSLARAWKSDVSKVFDSFWTKLSEKILIVKNHVWEGVTDFLEKDELNTDTVLIEQQKEQRRVLLYGFTVDVEGAYNRLSSVLNEVDRNVRRTQDTVSLKYAGRGRLLHTIGTLKEIEGLFTDLSIEFDGNTLSLRGVPEDISEAKLKIHEVNSEIVSGTFEHGFSSALVDFLNQIQRKNDVVYSIKEELEKAGVTAEIEITYKRCLMFVPPGNQCQAVQDTIIELVKEEEIVLEKESLPLLKEQIWDDLNDDLTERYEKTADVTLTERDRVHIIGLKKIVDTAKKQIERLMEENTIKTDLFPIDSLSHKFIKRYSTEEVKGIQRNLSEHHVVIKIRERDVQVKGTKEGLKLAKQELSQLFSKIRNKDHTVQKVGVTETMGNIALQLSDIETKTRCIIETPEMSGSTYLRQDPYQPEDSGGATWYDLEDEDDMSRTSSSADEPPGFKAKNGRLINIVKGEIGKQEAFEKEERDIRFGKEKVSYDYTTKKVSEVTDFLSSSGITFRQEQHSQKDFASIKKEISSINLKIYSDDINNIDNCIQELDRALEEEYTDYTLKDYIDLIKSLTKAEMDKLEQIECVVNMKIDQNAGIIRIQGPKKFVLDAQTELHKYLKDYERQRQRQEEAETLYQQIQWQFEEVKMDGIELVPYDKMTNLKIETAYKNKKASIELIDFTDRAVYVVDFMSLEEYIKGDKDNSATVVVRKDILKAAEQPLPTEWTAMKEDENIRITNLLASDSTYQQIEKRFVTEVTSGQYNRSSSIKYVKVTKIHRIQNKALYQQYVAKKELMTKQTPNPPAQFPIERTVWHGTSPAAAPSIQMHGFNRSYAGDKNGDPWYGHGVCFAADASYSARSWLSGANASGDGTTKGYIFLVKALTGEFCKGAKGMRFLPPKNPSNKTVLYDCAVDDVANPMEFVIFHDAQAYPEYLITFMS